LSDAHNLLAPGLAKIFFDVILGQQILAGQLVYQDCGLCAVMCALIWPTVYPHPTRDFRSAFLPTTFLILNFLSLFYQRGLVEKIAYRLSLNDAVIDILTEARNDIVARPSSLPRARCLRLTRRSL
jgi:hypothetical protein